MFHSLIFIPMKKVLPLLVMLVAGSLQLSADTMEVTCCDGRTGGVMGISLQQAEKYLPEEDLEAYKQMLGDQVCGKETCKRTVKDAKKN